MGLGCFLVVRVFGSGVGIMGLGPHFRFQLLRLQRWSVGLWAARIRQNSTTQGCCNSRIGSCGLIRLLCTCCNLLLSDRLDFVLAV